MTGDDRGFGVVFFESPFRHVQAQLGFTRLLVGAVTGKAILGEDGMDVAGKVELGVGGEVHRGGAEDAKDQKREAAHWVLVPFPIPPNCNLVEGKVWRAESRVAQTTGCVASRS